MARLRRAIEPLFVRLGMRAPPLSTLWIPRAVVDTRRRLRLAPVDAIVATGPPFAALVAGRIAAAGCEIPLVLELRDLWAGNPAYDAGGSVLGRVERWLFARADAIVVVTPEAAADVAARHPAVVARIHCLPNGFEPELLVRRRVDVSPPRRPIEVLHSGTLLAHRPLTPLLRELAYVVRRPSFRLVVHGHLGPESRTEIERFADRVHVEVLPPSGWAEAVERIRNADVALVTQSAAAGDATAIASKVYEYLALGRPVLCLTDGGATERLLQSLGADRFCARLDDPSAIAAALDRLLQELPAEPVPEQLLKPYDRRRVAEQMSLLLRGLATAN